MDTHKFTATEDEWRAFCKMLDIRSIASPGFAPLVRRAHAEGLLAPILANDSEAVQRRASELLEFLAAQIHSEYPTTPIQHPMVGVDAGGGVPEVEITSAMMEAGVAAMWVWYASDDEPAAAVRPIYEAMVKAAKLEHLRQEAARANMEYAKEVLLHPPVQIAAEASWGEND